MLAQFAAVWIFFTRLPAPFAAPDSLRALAAGAWAYPIVGAVIGALGGTAFWCAAQIGFPSWIAAVLALAAMALVTGGLHEDGLADVADGFGGGRTRADKLAIMRDSRIGTFGGLALVLTVLLRAGALAAMTPAAAMSALISAAALGRAAAAMPLAMLTPARTNGLVFDAGRVPRGLMAAALVLAAFIAVGATFAMAPGNGGKAVAIACAAAIAAAAALCALARAQIGGVTGDVAGAAVVLAETAALLGFVAALPR